MKNMWDHEVDVVIAGYGGAGAAAAIAAADGGASVMILEKNPEGGGTTKYSGGTMRTFLDANKSVDYIEALCDGTTDRAIIATYIEEAARNGEWLAGKGGEIVEQPTFTTHPVSALRAYPTTPGSDGIGPRVRVKGADSGGRELWALLARNVAARRVDVRYSAPARRLLVDKDGGVGGVLADVDGKQLRVRARRGVVLSCGGFEYADDMQRNYLGQSYFGLGNPANTGDGVRMAAEIGADLWHMNGVAATFGYKFAEFPCAIKQTMHSAGFIYVDQAGQRFMDEAGTDPHLMWAPLGHIDTKTLARPRVPSYIIFDEETRTRGEVASASRKVSGLISDFYEWSHDNSAEIKKGWIKAGGKAEDVAGAIGLPPEQLSATIAQYNQRCKDGYDPDHGRPANLLVPLGRPPYYAMEIHPCLFNTQGGPRRNARAQVLGVWGGPIPRLYSAGELGSLWHRNYPGAGNVSEALAFGRIAGKNVAAERPQGL